MIVGLPLHLSGETGIQAEKVQKFGAYLATQLSVPVEYWDERYTTVEASRLLTQAGIHPRKQRDQIDATAAAVLLQNYLDSHPHLQSGAFGSVEAPRPVMPMSGGAGLKPAPTAIQKEPRP